MINDRPVRLPVGPVAVADRRSSSSAFDRARHRGAAWPADWPAIALWWYGPTAAASPAAQAADPIFGRPLALLPLHAAGLAARSPAGCCRSAFCSFAMALFFFVAWRGDARAARPRLSADSGATRGLALTWALLLARDRGRRSTSDASSACSTSTRSSPASPTPTRTSRSPARGSCRSRCCSARWMPRVAGFVAPRVRWLIRRRSPALALYIGTGAVAAYVEGFIVKPNELVREQPFITHNIELTRQAFGLHRIAQRAFPAEPGGGSGRRGEQPDDAAEHPLVGLARAAGHAAPAPGDPHLLRLSRHRHRSLRHRRRACAR